MKTVKTQLPPHSREYRSPGELIERLNGFEGPPKQFLVELLATQCELTEASGGVILRAANDQELEVLAIYPAQATTTTPPVWLAQSIETASQVMAEGQAAVRPIYSTGGEISQLLMIPLRRGESVRGVAAFLVHTDDRFTLTANLERLELTLSLLSLYEMKLTLQRRKYDLRRLRQVGETLAAINMHDRFAAAAMAFCNQIASRWNCEHASLGFMKGRYIHLRALSHTENFGRKMKLVQHIETAMEECVDQDLEIVHPAPQDATYVSRAAAGLSRQRGQSAVISIPIRRNGKVLAVLTAERGADVPFCVEEIETLLLACEQCGPRLMDLEMRNRWIGARALSSARNAAATIVGPTHTGVKLTAAIVIMAAGVLIFSTGDYRPESSFVLEAAQQQMITAPFNGFIKSVSVEAGDTVQSASTVLAELDNYELKLRLNEVQAERVSYLKQADSARKEGDKTVEVQIAMANVDRIEAQIKLLEHQIQKARIVAPLTGRVLRGDLKRDIGAPVKTGDVLFEVAPLETLYANLFVTEDRIADIREGQRGELTTASLQKVDFTVERVNPIAEVQDQRNIFKVRVRLDESTSRMLPGMEGVARVSVGQRPVVWIWTRPVVEWIRMKLWI